MPGFDRTHDPEPPDLRALWLAELDQSATEQRWGLLLVALGWFHLAVCLACQTIVLRFGTELKWIHPLIWITEVFLTLVIARRICGNRWFWITNRPMTAVVTRVWVTYLILCFSVATLNNWIGWDTDWFKLIWCTVGTFGFATMAWIVSLRFLIPAFAMYFTALAMVALPHYTYAIHGLSFCATLTTIGTILERRRRRREALDPVEPSRIEAPAAPVVSVRESLAI